MKKEITVAVGVVAQDTGADGHNWFVGTFTAKEWKTIQRYVDIVKKEGLFSVSLYDSGSVFREPPSLRADYDLVVCDGIDIDDVEWGAYDDPDSFGPRADGITLVVTDDSIWWTWSDHYCDARCETEMIMLSDLEAAFNKE